MAKSKFQKKKEREREVKKKILSRREHKHAAERERARLDAEEKAVRHRQKPIKNEEFYAAKKLRDQEIRLQLEANLKLLQGLQAEYEEELKKRDEYVQQLGQEVQVDACGCGDSHCHAHAEDLADKPNLAEKAASRLNDIYEKVRVKEKM